MARVILYPYKMHSNSAIELQKYIQSKDVRCLRVWPDGNYRPKDSDFVVNWGNSNLPEWVDRLGMPVWINGIECVADATNKLKTFEALKAANVSIPEFTTDLLLATRQVRNGQATIQRNTLTGHSGSGITLWPEDFPTDESLEGMAQGKLFVQYIKKRAEYRVHVFKGQVIDVQQKRKKRGFEGEINTKIRTHGNGWVFTRGNLSVPDSVGPLAISAVNALGLDFGAVDIVYNNRQARAYVLEVNTAPGLEGQTIAKYGDAILGLL